MTQEEKQLLLKDLCGRLPYGVIVNCDKEVEILFTIAERGFFEVNDRFLLEDCKPYLRPMSSMTEEESKEFDVITNGERGFYEDEDGWIRCDNIHTKWGVWPNGCAEMLDWLNSHHFDYRGLIGKGLALEAREGMYKTE